MRYPYGKEEITGFMYEPWHIRYVGKDLAKLLTDHRLTLEEYFCIDSVYPDDSSSEEEPPEITGDGGYDTGYGGGYDYGYDDQTWY